MSYEFSRPSRVYEISDELEDALREYIDSGIRPGDFLTAVICNDLVQAVAKADDTNMANLPAFASYLYNEAPRQCWGSDEAMKRWISDKEDERAEEAERQKEIAKRERHQAAKESAGDDAYDRWKDDQMERDRGGDQ